ncbi:MAG TPA: VWA domain-containing protein [Blastocatellia bacterium]|nr:VWA domain-containing protein [Blastocatellia bacterium]
MTKSFVRFASLLIITLITSLTVVSQSSKNGGPKSPGTTPEKAVDVKQEKPADTSFDRPPIASPAAKDAKPQPSPDAAGEKGDELKLAVDLVVVDAQVMQQKTGRVVGTMKKEDFNLFEDGAKQQVTHFSQDTLPLSVILLVDRGGCLDPFSEKVRRASLEALGRLKPQDEVALMAFHNSVELVAGFTREKGRLAYALDHMPPHDEEANHCFNRAYYDAAQYMNNAANPDGRRVIIVITAITNYFDCSGPTGEEARLAVLESGSVVCGIIPKSAGQHIESGIMRTVTGIGGVFKARTSSLKQLADETGGEILSDKPENLDRTFNDLIDHLRTRYSIGFVSTNTRRDGTFRKLKLEVTQPSNKPDERLVVRTKRGYIARKASAQKIEKARTR